MPWTCPACSVQIQHDQDRPLPKRVYRCHVCRLELVLDEGIQKLVVVPFSEPAPPEPEPDAGAPGTTRLQP